MTKTNSEKNKNRLTVRLDTATIESLADRAIIENIDKSSIVKRAIEKELSIEVPRNRKVQQKHRNKKLEQANLELIGLIDQLRRIGINLNQIARATNEKKSIINLEVIIMKQLQELMELEKDILKAIYKPTKEPNNA